MCILFPCLSCIGNNGEAASKSSIATTISECRHYEGTEYMKLGRLATGAIKGIVRIAGMDDTDAKDATELMKGIHGLIVFSYDDCSEADKASIGSRLTDALADSEMLMEVSDSGEKVIIYGSYDERSDKVRDFVLYAPSESALICIKGSVSMDTVARIASND